MFCKYCSSDDIKSIENFYSNQIRLFAHKAHDALFKNFAPYHFIQSNQIKGTRCIDIGAGPSPLGFLLCDYFEEVHLIDLDVPNNFQHSRLVKKLGNFFDYVKNIPQDYFDFAIDGCSITHFEYNQEKNIGLEKCAEAIRRLLRTDGIFIMTSDVLPPTDYRNTNQKQYLKVPEIIEIFENYNLHLIKDFDYASYNTEMVVKLNWNNDADFTLNFANMIFKKGN